MSAAKKLSPKKAVCKHEGCFENPSTRGYCRLHFLSVLKGKSEGDQKPKGLLKAVGDETVPVRKKPQRDLEVADEDTTLDTAFAVPEAHRSGDFDTELNGRLRARALSDDGRSP
jgi:hypothetical protein